MDFLERLLYLISKNNTTKNKMLTDLHLGKNSFVNWSDRGTVPGGDVMAKIAEYFNVSVDYLLTGKDPSKNIPPDSIPYAAPRGYAPILGSIPAGLPALMSDMIEGYEGIDHPDSENYFWLRVKGDSMINAGIQTGDLVLVRFQPCAEPGQIIACRVNGDEATLKRFQRQGDSVILQPENSAYPLQIVPVSDFDNGRASVIGVAVEIKRRLL
jgi:repressor LexA